MFLNHFVIYKWCEINLQFVKLNKNNFQNHNEFWQIILRSSKLIICFKQVEITILFKLM